MSRPSRGAARFSFKAPTIPIPFHKLLRVVAIVDGEDLRTRQLLDHFTAEHFEIEVTDRFERDVSEDAGVGAYIALIDGDRRERAGDLARAVRAIGFRTRVLQEREDGRIKFYTYVVRQ